MGFATAEQFVSEGAYVYITGRREKELNAAVAKIGKSIATCRSGRSGPPLRTTLQNSKLPGMFPELAAGRLDESQPPSPVQAFFADGPV
jgi:NAD(P)-dependent dehydrogenase (short-subunit alcohol dehydrogenase family)